MSNTPEGQQPAAGDLLFGNSLPDLFQVPDWDFSDQLSLDMQQGFAEIDDLFGDSLINNDQSFTAQNALTNNNAADVAETNGMAVEGFPQTVSTISNGQDRGDDSSTPENPIAETPSPMTAAPSAQNKRQATSHLVFPGPGQPLSLRAPAIPLPPPMNTAPNAQNSRQATANLALPTPLSPPSMPPASGGNQQPRTQGVKRPREQQSSDSSDSEPPQAPKSPADDRDQPAVRERRPVGPRRPQPLSSQWRAIRPAPLRHPPFRRYMRYRGLPSGPSPSMPMGSGFPVMPQQTSIPPGAEEPLPHLNNPIIPQLRRVIPHCHGPELDWLFRTPPVSELTEHFRSYGYPQPMVNPAMNQTYGPPRYGYIAASGNQQPVGNPVMSRVDVPREYGFGYPLGISQPMGNPAMNGMIDPLANAPNPFKKES
ncbi:hypothetical protein IL306_012835 [Fusarium sp. DS 682]|nr:hypothetical protein IL306_012835 [Fusarium sp. DS 682]